MENKKTIEIEISDIDFMFKLVMENKKTIEIEIQRQQEAYNKASDMLENLVTISADIYEEYIKNHNMLVRLNEETNFSEEDLDDLAYYQELDERLGYLIILKALAAQGYVQDNEDCYRRWIKR